jgi:hypothetical protein
MHHYLTPSSTYNVKLLGDKWIENVLSNYNVKLTRDKWIKNALWN